MAGLSLAYLLLRSETPRAQVLKLGLTVLAVESAMVVISVMRLYLILAGMGLDVSLRQPLTLTVATVLASAVGFFPGGCGIRELIAAGLGPVASLPAATSAVAVGLDHVGGLFVLSFVTMWMIARRPPQPGLETLEDTS